MKNILNKKELLLLGKLNENVVPWNKSALGILSNAALRPFSWLTGNIKSGLKNQQINNLIQQYGLEVVKAIHKIDTDGIVGPDIIDGETKKEQEQGDTNNDTNSDTLIDKPLIYLNKFKEQLNVLQKMKPAVQEFIKLDDLDLKNTEYLKLRKMVNSISDIVEIDEFYKFLRSHEIPGTDEYEEIIGTYKKYVKQILETENVRYYINILQSVAGILKQLKHFIKILSDLEDLYDLAILEIEDQLKTNISESNGYRLPKDVTSLFSQKTLDKIENIPDIKEKMENTINKVRINTIAYEANYIIETSEKEKTKLQYKWQLGIQNIRDYFQNIIDPNLLPITSSSSIDTKTKSQIQKDQKQLSELQKLDITKTFPVAGDFDSNDLYAFECVITGQNGKNLRTILLLSPVEDFKESITDNKFRYFKIFGGYKFDKSIERINIFKYLTNNQKMINDFEKDTSYYYIAIQNVKPASKSDLMFIYSADGKMFFNNSADDINTISSALQKYKDKNLANSLKKIDKFGNNMKLLINQRFVIDNKNIEEGKYPSITTNAIRNSTDVKRTINNHKKLIKILS